MYHFIYETFSSLHSSQWESMQCLGRDSEKRFSTSLKWPPVRFYQLLQHPTYYIKVTFILPRFLELCHKECFKLCPYICLFWFCFVFLWSWNMMVGTELFRMHSSRYFVVPGAAKWTKSAFHQYRNASLSKTEVRICIFIEMLFNLANVTHCKTR